MNISSCNNACMCAEDNQQTPVNKAEETLGTDILIPPPLPPHWSMSLLLSQIHTWIFPRCQ